ncbi:MAG TPA: bleomycin resistance protein [Cyanobacteria bacterium UBA8156]|jgi:catechol 2,3-dioxygenase-like lactoylglutathione lyase family enzyme|nr:bleomycin resistance protein [Cyanobacteria bacterium UBA8156]
MAGLGQYLHGVQHIGITVENLAQSLEFYLEVFGGQLVVGESNMTGDTIQNTLFQVEELAEDLSIPNLRDGAPALDVRFISFGNTVVELIHFRDRQFNAEAPSLLGRSPSHIGSIGRKHLSFEVKETIDLTEFATKLEAECRRRGIPNVVCNRVVRARTAAERDSLPTSANAFKFWDEPGQPTQDWGEFEGWSLFYCKGPSGEQLEFNQVTRNVKKLFRQGRETYNQINETNFGV